MHSFEALQQIFESYFNRRHFPDRPGSLYEPAEYFLGIGGKRIRPVMCLMGNELFDDLHPDALPLAVAIELFHNFTLIHDDIMDKAPLRRGKQTVHAKFGEPTALLGGDVMLVRAYDYINQVDPKYLKRVMQLFNQTARQVCEGQQLDMDFEKRDAVSLEEYIEMISLKTSVLLAASLSLGAILGGAGQSNQKHLYEFGRNLGIAFQVQDDYLDAFGDPAVFGKQVGGDILSNKKTFLVIRALEVAKEPQRAALIAQFSSNAPDKVERVLELFRACGIDTWAQDLKQTYVDQAMTHLDEVAVMSARKSVLSQLARYLVDRVH